MDERRDETVNGDSPLESIGRDLRRVQDRSTGMPTVALTALALALAAAPAATAGPPVAVVHDVFGRGVAHSELSAVDPV
jgi:hypothetical protein